MKWGVAAGASISWRCGLGPGTRRVPAFTPSRPLPRGFPEPGNFRRKYQKLHGKFLERRCRTAARLEDPVGGLAAIAPRAKATVDPVVSIDIISFVIIHERRVSVERRGSHPYRATTSLIPALLTFPGTVELATRAVSDDLRPPDGRLASEIAYRGIAPEPAS